jgi:hypothetical protein
MEKWKEKKNDKNKIKIELWKGSFSFVDLCKINVGQIREKYDLINRIILCFGSRNISVDV